MKISIRVIGLGTRLDRQQGDFLKQHGAGLRCVSRPGQVEIVLFSRTRPEMRSASQALQAAIHGALSADAEVLKRSGRASHLRPCTAEAELSVRHLWTDDPAISTGSDSLKSYGNASYLVAAAARNEVHRIVDALRSALHDRDLPIAGHPSSI